MKVVQRCLGCDKITRVHGSFNVKLQERTKSILTGDIKEVELRGKICRDCARIAGYNVKEKNS